MLLEEFPPDQRWFVELEVRVDLGFFGIEKDFEFKELFIPHKKPKGKELTEKQKADNKLLAGKRIAVEHALAGLKRYRILSDRLRMHDFELYDVMLEVCAGLWNFYLTH